MTDTAYEWQVLIQASNKETVGATGRRIVVVGYQLVGWKQSAGTKAYTRVGLLRSSKAGSVRVVLRSLLCGLWFVVVGGLLRSARTRVGPPYLKCLCLTIVFAVDIRG